MSSRKVIISSVILILILVILIVLKELGVFAMLYKEIMELIKPIQRVFR